MTDSENSPPAGDDRSNPPGPAQEGRRSFFKQVSSLAALSLVEPAGAWQRVEAPARPTPSLADSSAARLVPVSMRINGQTIHRTIDTRTTVLDLLREQLDLTGTKKGCDHGACGACTVHINGQNVSSCLALAVMHQQQDITTIEGLGSPDKLHPMQAAFIEHDGFQCGYCTSGQIMSAVTVVRDGHARTETQIRELMSGNICRCGAYNGIVAAMQSVAAGKTTAPRENRNTTS